MKLDWKEKAKTMARITLGHAIGMCRGVGYKKEHIVQYANEAYDALEIDDKLTMKAVKNDN